MHNFVLNTTAAIHASVSSKAATVLRPRLDKLRNEEGMTTIEYAFGSLAAAALAGVLYMVVNGNGVTTAIEGVITDALSRTPK